MPKSNLLSFLVCLIGISSALKADPFSVFQVIPNPDPDADQDDQFGSLVTLDGNLVLVGARRDDASGPPDSGAAYLFDLSTATLVHTFLDPTPMPGDHLGEGGAIVSGMVFLGDHGDDAGASDTGTVRRYDASTGSLVLEIFNPSPLQGELFGWRLFADDAGLIVTQSDLGLGGIGPGFVYLYDFAGNLVQTYLNPTPVNGDRHGWAAVATATHVVASTLHAGTPSLIGEVQIYDRSTGTLLHTLTNPILEPNANFGISVAVVGDTVFVGASASAAPTNAEGRVYAFDIATGALLGILENPTPDPVDLFGGALAAHGDLLVVGSRFDDAAADNGGAVHVFTSDTFTIVDTILSPTPADGARFGSELAADDEHIVVAADSDLVDGAPVGKVYVFHADSDEDGVGNAIDLCPGTPQGEIVDSSGCSDSQVDEDLDGLCNPDAATNGPSGCTGSDSCPNSDLQPTIVIDGVDTGVENDLLSDGCTVSDLITDLLGTDPVFAEVVQLLVSLKGDGVITGEQLGEILKTLKGS